MVETDWLTDRFEVSRPRLRAVAYRMLGSHTEADDAVQETWLRLDRTDAGEVENLSGWLTTVVARVCLDRLRARRLRREDPIGDGLLDEIAGVTDDGDPEDHALLAESVGSALLVVLDMLSPTERVAFVLHDIFAVSYDEIGSIVGKSPDAARQIASRARRRLQGASAVPDFDLTVRRELIDAFFAAARAGDFDALLSYLDPDVAIRPDTAAVRRGGGAALRARGAKTVAKWGLRGARATRPALVDGVADLVWTPSGRIEGVAHFTIVDGKIVEIELIGDPERLSQFDIVFLDE